MQVTVLGGGSWGTTVASLSAGRNPTLLWARSADVADEINTAHTNTTYLPGFPLPSSLRATADLEEAVGHAQVLVVGVPSHGFRQVLAAAKPFVHPWIPIVSLTKGLEQGTLLRMTEVIKDVLPGHPAAALTGPNLAKEIMSGQAAAAVIATEDQSVAAELQTVLRRGLFRVYRNHDVIGCELAGAMKNVVAIANGMAEGLSVGDNTRAAVITRGLSELTRLGVSLGGEVSTFAGLAGMGDLLATCMSPTSRNRYVGEQLGRGRPIAEIVDEMSMVAEGVKTAVTVHELAARQGVDIPICGEVYKVVTGQLPPAEAYRGLFSRESNWGSPGHEHDPD